MKTRAIGSVRKTIYRYVYSKEGMAQELWWHLPTHRKSRKPRRARKRLPPKFHRDVSILFRPDVVAHRQEFGHWEGDLMLFKQHFGTRNVTSLVERVSRFTVLLKNEQTHQPGSGQARPRHSPSSLAVAQVDHL